MTRTIGYSGQWFKDNGDFTHRLNYDLNENSIIFDLGGHVGWFTEQMNEKYGSKIFCFEPIISFYEEINRKFGGLDNIKIFPLAISDVTGKETIYFDENASSLFVPTTKPIEINCVTLNSIFDEYNIKDIDLIKINIEGAEYSLLESMIRDGLISKCKNIQVQFHIIVENYEVRYEQIKKELEKTHKLTYKYPFVWENWEIKK